MTITVVTTRADNGAPATRDVYAGGVSYAIVNGDLQVVSAGPSSLAFYGSGNWLSVYVDESVEVFSGKWERTTGESSDADSGSSLPVGGDAGGDSSVAIESDEPGSWDALPDEEIADEEESGDAEEMLEVVDLDAAPDAPDARAEAREEASEEASEVAGAGTPAAAARPAHERPAGMRAVVIRPRTYVRASDEPAPAPARNPRMLRVTVRPRSYDGPVEAAPPQPRNPRLRPVVIRPKSPRPRLDDDADEAT